jgi:hypothetical protein
VRLPKPEKRAKAKKAPPRKSKRPRRKLLAYADSLWSQIIRRPGACVICGARERLQGAHGFSRRYHATRHDLRNGFCLCSGCHVYYTYRPIEWDDWMLCNMGSQLYEELRAKALQNSRVDLDCVVTALEAVLHSGAALPEGA